MPASRSRWRRSLGSVGGNLGARKGVLTHVADERRVLPGFIITALSAVLGLIGVLTAILAVVSPFITWLLVSGLMQLVTRFFGGDGPFSGILVFVGVAQVPSVIVGVSGIAIASLRIALGPESPATTIVGLLGSLLGLAALLWFAALVVVGAAFARRIGYGESTGSCAISCVGCMGLIVLRSVVIIAVIVAVAGTLNSARTT
jgi:hypothetical protein